MKTAILFFILLSIILSSCGANGEQEVVVVPQNFRGYIIIIFNQKNGSPPKYEGKKRVYEIPRSGILITQFEPNEEWQTFPEYYDGKIAPENKLSSFAEIEKVPVDTIVGFMGAAGSMRKKGYNEDRFMFAQFFVGTKADIKYAQKQTEKADFVLGILKQAK